MCGNPRGCVDLSGANRDKRHFVCECMCAYLCIQGYISKSLTWGKSVKYLVRGNTVCSQQATCKWRRPQMPGTRVSPKSAFSVNISCHPSLLEGWFMRASHSLIALCARVCVHPRGRAARQLQEASKCPKLPAYFLPPILPIYSRHARQQEKGFGGVGGGLFSLFRQVHLIS